MNSNLIGFKLDHIGIAVNSLEEGKKFYLSLGYSEMSIEDVVGEGVRVGMFELDNQSRIELLEPLNDESPIKKFLTKKGPGVHHYCLRVENLDELTNRLIQSGVKMIYPQSRKGAHNCLINFVHPSSAGGVLVELSEKLRS